MTILPTVNPRRVGFVPERLEAAFNLLQRWQESGEVSSSALCVGRRGGMVEPRLFGVPANATFLVASITKPVTAAAVLLLAERGRLTLEDRVADVLPEFAQEGKADVRIRHLLTHTSGLPDMLPENEQLRAAHSPLSAFVEGACRQPLAFAPGTGVRYQSTGYAVLAEIVQRVSETPFAEFLRREFFEPLEMTDTALGVTGEAAQRIAPIPLPPEKAGLDWNWNSPYWRSLGAPWGGLITSPSDFARYCRMMLDEGTFGRTRVLSPATVRAMTSNQLNVFPDLPEPDRRCRPWGLGWRLNWPGSPSSFGDLLGPATYGHWGATGTLCWIDPDANAFCLLFTTRPHEEGGHILTRISNIVASAMA